MVVHSPTKTTSTPWPALLPMGALAGKPPIPIARPATLVGSRQTANLRLHSSQVSKAHALILSSESKVYIRDLNSRTKVFVNSNEVREADLREGDQVKIGRFTFRFTAGPKIQSSPRRRTLPAGQLETEGGDEVPLDQRVIVIGQRAGCDLVIPGGTASTTHAAIYDVNGRRYIMDLGSRSGTFVNDQKTIQVELKIGDVIDIGGTEVRYVGAAGAVATPERVGPVLKSVAPAAAASAAAEPADADLDELLALESLGEAPAPPKPSGQSKIFEPPASVPEDSNAPIPLEDEMKLPEPQEVRERIEIESEAPIEAEAEAPAEVEAQPETSEASAKDIAAEKAAEDELMALLEETPVEPEPQIKAQVEPESEAEQIAIEQEPEAIEELPPAVMEEAPIPVEDEPIAIEQEATAPIEETPRPPVEEQPIAVEEEPVAIEQASPAPVEEAPAAVEEQPIALGEEPIAIEERSPAPVEEAPAAVEEQPIAFEEEPVAIAHAPPALAEEAPPALEEAAPEIAAPVEEPEPVAMSEPEISVEPAPELAASSEAEIPAESIAPDEPEIPLEIAPEPTVAEMQEPVGEVVGTTTAHVEVVPQPVDEVAEEVKEASAAFEADELPIVPEDVQTPEPEPSAQPVVEESAPPIPVDEPDLQEILEDEPAISEQIVQAPPEPEVEASASAPAEPEAKEVPLAIPEAPLAAPPKPRWVVAPSTVQFTPTVLTIKPPRPPVDFDLDELLGEKKTPFAAGQALPPIQEAPTKAPQPPVIEEKGPEEVAPEPQTRELIPPTPVAEEQALPPVDEPVDSDDLALAALEELAPPQPVAEVAPVQEQPESEPVIEPTPAPEPPPAVATTSTAILPEPPKPISTSSTIAPAEEDAPDLLEELPDEPELASAASTVDESASPILSSATAPPAEAPNDVEESPAAADVFSFGQVRAKAGPAPTAPHHHRASPGRIPPRPRTAAPIPPRWGPLATAVVAEHLPPAPRRARRKLSVLLVLMLVAMVVAALVVWKIVLPRVIVQGTIRFDNTTTLRGEAREIFQKQQLDLLADTKTRATAEGLFKVRKPTAAGFFVEQDFQSPQLKREWVSNGDRSELQITYQGTDPTLDADRLFCLMQAIYDANSGSVNTASAATKTADQKRMAASAARAELNKVRERRLTLEAIVRPDPAELSAAQAAVEKLDQAWTGALAARKAIAADVDRLSQPAESAATGAASDADSALKLMSEKLAALNGRVAEAKSAAAKQAADARKSLNASIEDFQTSLGAAQAMMKDNTALAAYVSSAQKLHEASWKFQGDLIERQERQQKQLLEYKNRLEEQVEARRREVLEKDTDLKELNHLLELKSREVNALSASGGLKRDVERLRGEMQYIEGRITSRKVAIGDDKFYSDAIGGLKQIIDSVQKQLDADRAASEKLMNDLETRFRNTSPEIETLPAAQRTMAARLASQVDAMQAARKGYTEAVQAQDADANKRLKELQAQAVELESEIALRRKEVAAEQQKKLTDQQAADLQKKQAALAEAEKAERSARDAYRQKIKELDLLVDRDRAYQSTREELQRLARVDEPIKQDQYTAADRAATIAQRAADSAIAPQPPVQPKILDIQDYRFLFGTGAVLVVGLLFGSVIFFTVHSEPRQRRGARPASPSEEKPIST
jgi:pSer/pThr/pTyr-binding forkhead associated (FHA) protein